ncbi:uncharacterized protein LOC111920934 [Lactuca sativa]|uniref:DUF7054 domain-containing protein n=1 Tax=Lactuca sativa TaxID=4236 RepID=A0A9R1XK95_LACSA|nr:uncharacterized protein LOC111920934 [Lactuca sativa]KAJ0215919.1 hypothetical protein LSAT_V11C300123210 [Lactuca sativa]
MLAFKQKKDQVRKSGGKRILIKINVVGSSGPIRFVVNEEEVVAAVIETALKSYAREDRLPVLGTKFSDFFLYTPVAGTEALGPWEMIGTFGVRNFMLWKKPGQSEGGAEITRKRSGRWKSWLSRSLSLKANQ